MSIFLILVISCWIVFAAYWTVNSFTQKKTAQKPDFRYKVLMRAFMGIPFLLLVKPEWLAVETQIAGHTFLSGMVGLVVCIAGLVTCLWARRLLAGNWSNILDLKEDHVLVQEGPYRFVRHPIYSGFLLMYLGTAIVVGKIGGLIGFFVLFAGCLIRIHKEESLLTVHFGDEYQQYKKQVKALIPFVF